MPQILYDLFPAHVSVAYPGSEIELQNLSSSPLTPGTAPVLTARVIVTDSRILIATDGPTGPIPVFSQAYTPGNFHKSAFRNEDSFLQTDEGHKIAFKKDEACGCGSRLKSWNPYNVLTSKNDPTE